MFIFDPRARDIQAFLVYDKNKIDPSNHVFDFAVLTVSLVQNRNNFISVLILQLNYSHHSVRKRWLTKQNAEFWLKISWIIRDEIKLFGFSTVKTAKSEKVVCRIDFIFHIV